MVARRTRILMIAIASFLGLVAACWWGWEPANRAVGQWALDQALIRAINVHETVGMQQLLDRGANVDVRGNDGRTVLMVASMSGWGDNRLLRTALRLGGDPNVRDRYGLTPLARAAKNADVAAVRRLLLSGADANATIEGKSLLAWFRGFFQEALHSGAFHYWTRERAWETLRMLEQAGAQE